MISTAPTLLKIVHVQRNVDPEQIREDKDEVRHRMKVNFAAAIVLLGLLTLGIWLVDALVDTQKVQGCYASGARSCSLI